MEISDSWLSKGQTFMPDFMASLVVFGIILTIFLSTWNSVLSHQTGFEDEERMYMNGRHTTGFLVSTSGFPDDWNSSTVQVPGFASSDNILEEKKLEEFDNIEYDRQRKLLLTPEFYLELRRNGSVIDEEEVIGDEPVAYMVQSSDDFTDVKILHILNDSEITWDLYWPSNRNLDQLDGLSARNVYNHTQNSAEMMEDMASNLSREYQTAITEDVDVDHTEIDNEGDLEGFVEAGGSFLHSENDVLLIEHLFGIESLADTSQEGNVKQVSPLLNSSIEEGDNVEFDNSPRSYKNPDKVFVNGTGGDVGCLACMWEIGSGQLYYISDVSSSSGDLLSFEESDSVLGNIFSFGKEMRAQSTVIPFKRSVIINKSDGKINAEMRYIVWN